MLAPDFAAIPGELRNLPRWVVWKGAKVPYCPTAVNSKASATDPGTWATFDQAQTAYDEGDYLGVGFALNGDGIVGIDLDKCVTDTTPTVASIDLMMRIGCTYIEFSPSGTGLRGFGYGESLDGKRKKGILDGLNVELYANARYLTVTGRPLLQGPLSYLKGFASVADDLRKSPTEEAQKMTEEHVCHLLLSSVGIPSGCLPTSEGERNRCLFSLARYVKGKRPDATREELREIAREWHRLALPVIATKEFSVTLTDFIRGWESVKHPHGATLNTIIESIDFAAPLPDGIEALGYGPAANRLVQICAALQAHEGDQPFFISSRQAGELIGLHFTDASKVLAALVADGVLELVRRGTGKLASRYRYIGLAR